MARRALHKNKTSKSRPNEIRNTKLGLEIRNQTGNQNSKSKPKIEIKASKSKLEFETRNRHPKSKTEILPQKFKANSKIQSQFEFRILSFDFGLRFLVSISSFNFELRFLFSNFWFQIRVLNWRFDFAVGFPFSISKFGFRFRVSSFEFEFRVPTSCF